MHNLLRHGKEVHSKCEMDATVTEYRMSTAMVLGSRGQMILQKLLFIEFWSCPQLPENGIKMFLPSPLHICLKSDLLNILEPK